MSGSLQLTPMIPITYFVPRMLSACLLVCTCARLGAAPKIDLDRLTPVPGDQPVPIEDFLRPGLWQQAQMNPSGTHVAALEHGADDRLRLVILDLNSGDLRSLEGDVSNEIYRVTWLDDKRIVFFVSTRKIYSLGMLGVDIDKLSHVYSILQYCAPRLVSIPRQDRQRPLVWMARAENGRDGGVVVVNTNIQSSRFVDVTSSKTSNDAGVDTINSNRKHIVSTFPAPKKGIVYDYMADREGALKFAFTSTDGILAIHRLESQRWLPCPIDLEVTEVLAPGDKTNEIIAVYREADDRPAAAWFMDAETGERTDALAADKDYDFVGSIYREAASQQIVGVTYQREVPRTIWFGEGFQAIQKSIDALFPGTVAQILDNSEQGARFLVRTFSDKQPQAYHWVDLEKRTSSLLNNTRPWIDPERMRPMRVIKFKTNDGRQLDAYVTLPDGASKQHPVPLVVLPHGGPWVRDTWGFNGEVQFLASRGYAVLQPNYRGSPGHDWKFPLEDQWEFRKMHDDVTAATRTLLTTGLIDANRVAIMGGSFGAYLALSGVAHEPTLYRCAVTIAGVFDWATVMREDKESRFTNPTYTRMRRKLGDPKKQADKFAAISPVRHVANVRVPIFVAHGEEDPIAPITESKQLVNELERYKIPYEKLFVRDESHGMARLKNDVELYDRIEKFLAKHLLGPIPSEAAPAGDS